MILPLLKKTSENSGFVRKVKQKIRIREVKNMQVKKSPERVGLAPSAVITFENNSESACCT